MHRTMTPDHLEPATRPTLYFIGVTTGSSSIRGVFPRWAEVLGLEDVELVGIDVALHAPAEQYRAVVGFMRHDPLSRGALVTTHKMDLYAACADVFDEVDPLAELMTEVSCLAVEGGRVRASAKDPWTSGLALQAFVPQGHWEGNDREVLVLGAGGSAVAMDWHLCRTERGADRPAVVTVTDLSASRLELLRSVHQRTAPDVPLRTRAGASAEQTDELLAALPAGSLVVNATGLGKDAPGSPIGARATFPHQGLVWELNYRGDLVFLRQAQAQQAERELVVEDGWTYFLHGWTRVIAEVFQVDIPTSGPAFDRLSDIAAGTRS